MRTKVTLYADDGKVLTNGEIYGKQINLAEGLSSDGFYEITEAEYEEIMHGLEDEDIEIKNALS